MVLGRPRYSRPPGHGPGFHDDYDFYSEFDLADIADESLRELAQRARDAGLEVTLALGGRYPTLLVISFPTRAGARNVTISSSNSPKFSDIEFARYEFLSRYDAIRDKRSGTIEAKVGYASRDGANFVLSRMAEPAALVVTGPAGAEIRFGNPSATARALLRTRDDMPDTTLTITGTHVTSCDDAARQLDDIGVAFLFQLSLVNGYLCSLVQLKAADTDPFHRFDDEVYKWDLELAFPQRRMPPDPLKLYYYAGTLSNEYPSLRFLAYYQVLEYFFVQYSHLDMAESVSLKLRGDDFDAADVHQVAQVVEHVLRGARRRGFGSEREQLLATITRCVDPGRLRGLLTSHEHDGVPLGLHLADPHRLTGVSLVDIDQTGDDKLLAAVATRIYDIRNRVVHAKRGAADNGPEPLFPFSAESAALPADIEVLRYVAASVLIESAVSMD
jgi:hypothetical protein